jgi:hypothetical protein
MGSHSDFWLTLHKLASDLLREGETGRERGQNICRVFNSLSPSTRGVYVENLEAVFSALAEVRKHCKPAG